MFLTILKKLQCLSFLALVIFCEANSATQDFPGISLNESLHFGPATTRLVYTWDDVDSRNDERQTCFRIDFFQENEWVKVGMMSVQVKGPQSDENKYYQDLGINFGTYVRLHHIQIDETYREGGIGTQAMKTFLDFYESKGGFDCFKLEACDWKPHLGMWYKKHGFIKKENPIEPGSTVYIYTKERQKIH